MNKRYKIWRRILIFWTIFIGTGAVGGALAMFIDPMGKSTGMEGFLPYFQALPLSETLFGNLIFSGIMLLIVNGITNLCAAALLIKKKKAGIISGGIFGITLMTWIVIQFVILPFNFMSTTYFVFGALQLIAAVVCYVGCRQSEFNFNPSGYENVGSNPKNLIVYYSRTGYTEKLAYEKANESGAAVFKLNTTEKTAGDLGFWWCGRFGMEKLPMNLEDIPQNLEDYESVTLFSPTWVFGVSAPAREFIGKHGGSINNFGCVFTHFMGHSVKNLKKETERLCGKQILCEEYRMRFGVAKKIG